MNAIFWVILAAVLLDFAIGVISTNLNIRRLKYSAPDGLEDVYETDEYRKSQEYTRTQSRFGLIVGSFKLVALLSALRQKGHRFHEGNTVLSVVEVTQQYTLTKGPSKERG